MDAVRRDDDEDRLPENHIYLSLPGVNKPIVIFFPADKITAIIIIAIVCATFVLSIYLVFVKGDQQNVAGLFGHKPAVATAPARTTQPAALCPCESPDEPALPPPLPPRPVEEEEAPTKSTGTTAMRAKQRPAVQRERIRPSRSPALPALKVGD
jgi:hypothetical protein